MGRSPVSPYTCVVGFCSRGPRLGPQHSGPAQASPVRVNPQNARGRRKRKRKRKMITNLQKWRNLAISVNPIIRNDVVFHNRLLHNGPDTIDELLDRHIVKNDKTHIDDDEEDELLTGRRLTSTRREALSLYRDIIRATRFFVWPHSRGVLWRDVLRENARKEFEDARFEKDPEIVTRLLIGGHDAVQSALDKLVEKQKQQIEKERGGGDRR